jgi:N-acetyl-anhydromuramyl-L-alanine amidase AmpD
MLRHNIPPERIVGHRDYATYKSCPGTKFDLERFRVIAGGLRAGI